MLTLLYYMKTSEDMYSLYFSNKQEKKNVSNYFTWRKVSEYVYYKMLSDKCLK